MAFNIDKLRMGDLDDFEDAFDLGIADVVAMIGDDGSLNLNGVPRRMLTGLAFLVGRLDDPGFTPEQAKGVTVAELFDAVSSDEEQEKPAPISGKKGRRPSPGAAA